MAKGKLRIVVGQKPRPIWNQTKDLISIRTENNSQDIMFNYQNLDPANITAMQVLYQEGIPNDPSQTYIVVTSQQNQNITANAGSILLHIVSNGKADQLDKFVDFNIGTNQVRVYINFESRPDTLDMLLSTSSYTIPIQITKQAVLTHFSDFDGSAIIKVGVETGGAPNFKYNNQPYIDGTLVDIDTLDSIGFYYVPDVNPQGYQIAYPWIVEDETGLITKV